MNVRDYSDTITVNCCTGTVQMLWVGSPETCWKHDLDLDLCSWYVNFENFENLIQFFAGCLHTDFQ